MSIVEASQQSTVLAAALAYLEMGISVLPCVGKQPHPALKGWSQFQIKPAPFSYVHNWHRNGFLQNVGIIGGAVSGGLCLMDLDGEEAVERFELTFSNLLDTFTVRSGSGKGKHFYYYADKLPASTRTKGYELRVDGLYVVAPPSIHPDTGKRYEVINPVEIKRVPDLKAVMKFITETIKKKQRDAAATATSSMVVGGTMARGKYTLTASEELALEVERVSFAPTGNGNNTLYRAALKLGSLVTDGELSINEIEIALMRASSGWQVEGSYITFEQQCMRTIKSGLTTGMNSSRKTYRQEKEKQRTARKQ